MTKKKTILLTSCLIIVTGIVLLVFADRQTHLISRLLDDYLYDNRNHYLTCEELPATTEVKDIINVHRDEVEALVSKVGGFYFDTPVRPVWQNKSVTDGGTYIAFSWEGSCMDKNGIERTDIEISYPSHRDRVRIEELLPDDTFYGIPYRLLNY